MYETNSKAKEACPEVMSLIQIAREFGEADSYSGKRTSTRIAEALQLEVTQDTPHPSPPQAVTMHNISTGGCSFWFRRKLERNAKLYLREFTEDNSSPWVPGHVTHCTQAICGFLVGVAFERPPG